MAIKLTEAQRQALPEDSETPVEVSDGAGVRYYLISEHSYAKLRELLDSEEIDPSLYEFEDAPELK